MGMQLLLLPHEQLTVVCPQCERRYVTTASNEHSLCVCTRTSTHYEMRLAVALLNFVSDKLKMQVRHMTGPRRSRPITRARALAIWLIRNLTALSYTQIGILFNKDHSSAILAFQKYEFLYTDNSEHAFKSDTLLIEATDIRSRMAA